MDVFKEMEDQDIKELQDSIERSQKAKVILEDPIIKDFIEESQDSLFSMLDTIPLNDKEARIKVTDMIWVFRKFEKALKEHIEFGELSYKKWKELMEVKKTFKEDIF